MKKEEQINMFFLVFCKIKIEGLVNKEIQNKLNPQVPTIEITLKISNWFKKLKTIKFQGKPVKIVPLKNSKIPKIKEKVRKEVKIFFGFKIIKIQKINP